MPREMIVHFEPRGGGNYVKAEVFVATLEALIEGFRAMSGALAPAFAQRRNWSREQVREALTVGFSAVERGSVRLAVQHGCSSSGAHLDDEWMSKMGWAATSRAINGAARGVVAVTEVPVLAAESFARAAKVARDANVDLSLCSRRVRGETRSKWHKTLDLTAIEPALAKYVARHSSSESTITQVVGKLTALDHDPPSFVLETGRGKSRIAMRVSLREKARQFWGQDVIVIAEGKITSDGKVRDLKANDITPATVTSPEENEDAAFGLLKDAFGTEQAREYFGALRGEN